MILYATQSQLINKPIDNVCANGFVLIYVLYFQSTPVLTRLGVEKSKIQTRSVVRQQQQKKTRQPNATLQEAKRKAKEKLASQKIINDTIVCKDIFQSAMDSVKNVRGHTGIVYDNRMAEHRCLWDPNYPECPERFTRVLERYVLKLYTCFNQFEADFFKYLPSM